MAILRQTSDDFWLAWTLHCLANATDLSGDETEGQRLHGESLRLFKRNGNRWGIALGLIGTGLGASRRGDHHQALELYEHGLSLQRELKIGYLSDTLNALGRVEAATGHLTGQSNGFERVWSTAVYTQRGGRPLPAWRGLPGVALAHGLASSAVRLLAAAASIRSDLATGLTPKERATFEDLMVRAEASVDTATFQTEWATGSTFTWEQAVTDSLSLSFGTAHVSP